MAFLSVDCQHSEAIDAFHALRNSMQFDRTEYSFPNGRSSEISIVRRNCSASASFMDKRSSATAIAALQSESMLHVELRKLPAPITMDKRSIHWDPSRFVAAVGNPVIHLPNTLNSDVRCLMSVDDHLK